MTEITTMSPHNRDTFIPANLLHFTMFMNVKCKYFIIVNLFIEIVTKKSPFHYRKFQRKRGFVV